MTISATAQIVLPDNDAHTAEEPLQAHIDSLIDVLEQALGLTTPGIGVSTPEPGPYLVIETELRPWDREADPAHALLPRVLACPCCSEQDAHEEAATLDPADFAPAP